MHARVLSDGPNSWPRVGGVTHTMYTIYYLFPEKMSDFNESQLNEYTSTSVSITFENIFRKELK